MWRRLNDDERKILLANYKFGACLMRFVMGLWLIFVVSYGIEGVKQLFTYVKGGDYLEAVLRSVELCVVAVFIYISCYFIRTTGTEEIKVLKNEEILIASGIFVSSERVFRGSRKSYYKANVRIIDQYGNTGEMVECRLAGNLGSSCREGDKVSILMQNQDKPEELMCFKLKIQ